MILDLGRLRRALLWPYRAWDGLVVRLTRHPTVCGRTFAGPGGAETLRLIQIFGPRRFLACRFYDLAVTFRAGTRLDDCTFQRCSVTIEAGCCVLPAARTPPFRYYRDPDAPATPGGEGSE